MKKMFIHNKGLLFIGLYLVLKIVGLIVFDTPLNKDIEMNSSQYFHYLNQVNGPYSKEIAEFFSNQSNEIENANIAIEKAYNNYYDGNITEEELKTVTKPLEKIVQNESGFKVIFDQFMYIREKPEERYFLYTNGWDGLLSSDNLDVLFLLLILGLVTPAFCYEYENKMEHLVLSVKKGTKFHALSKIVLVLITVTVLCIISSCLSYGFYQFKYGLNNGNYPLQSLSYFSNSSKIITLFVAFLLLNFMKIFGNLCFAMLIMFVSVCIKKYAFTLFASTAIIILPYYGFNLESSKYYLPGPLGFILSTGFFRGNEYEYNPFTDKMDLTFQEISTTSWSILFVISLCISIGMFITIIHKHTNNWCIKKRSNWFRKFGLITPILWFLVTSLSGCIPNDDKGTTSIYNFSSRQSYENEQYRFYLDEKDLKNIRFLFEDKKTGEIRNFIRNPMQALTTVGNSIYGKDHFVYYMKYDYEKSEFREKIDRFSIIEVNTKNFEEKNIFEKNINQDHGDFFNVQKRVNNDFLTFKAINSFFLDEQNIYLIGQNEIKRVSKLTGKISVIIRFPVLRSVAFDGRNIYYINEKYQVAKYDTKLDSEIIIQDIVTKYFVLTEKELLYLNRKDQQKVYSMNLNSLTSRKIIDKSVLNFTCDDQYIFYESETNLKKYRIDRDGKNDGLYLN
nr:DUF5050 domain-containing protein [Lysinibacillus fusiformis]